MRTAFELPVGYSDHTDGFEISLAAVALGATIIEKHLTLDRNAEGPDHAASLEPADFKRMVSAIRNIEGAIGDGVKTPKNSEIKNMPIARKSLVAARPLKAGDVLGPDDITSKRPGSGRPPIEYWSLIGTTVTRTYDDGRSAMKIGLLRVGLGTPLAAVEASGNDRRRRSRPSRREKLSPIET